MTSVPIAFNCPACGKLIRAKPTAAGRTLACPGCQTPVTVPNAPATEPTPATDPHPAITPEPTFAPSATPIRAYESHLPKTRAYPALSLLITIYRLIAWLMLIGVLVGILITLAIAIKSRGDAGAMLGLLITVGPALLTTTIVATFTLGVAESMKLALDIQSNTLAAAHAARRHD